MNILDVRTILIGYVASNIICLIAMTYLWQQNRQRYRGLGFWMIDYIFQVVALLLIALRGFIPDFLSIVFSNILGLTGTVILYIGLQRFLGKKQPSLPNWIILAVFAGVQYYFTFNQPSLFYRNINLSSGLMLVTLQAALLMIFSHQPRQRRFSRFVGAVFATYVVINALRIFLDFTVPPSTDFFQSGLYDSLAILIYQMLFITLTVGLFLLVNRELVLDLENEIDEIEVARTALVKSEEKYAKAFHNIPEVVIITRASDGNIIDVNDSFYRMSGYTREEASGKTTIDLHIWENPSERNRLVSALSRTGRVTNFQTSFRRKNGRHFPAAVFGEKLVLNGVECVLTVVQDMTWQKRSEEKIRDLNRGLEARVQARTVELEASNRELESFAYSVSHDLRTPLRSISGWSYLLKEESGNAMGATGVGYLDRIMSEVHLMGKLIDDLLDLARVTRVELQKEPVDLSSGALAICARLSAYFPQQKIEFVIQPGIIVNGDRRLLEVALTNLFDNAIKFTGKVKHPRVEFKRVQQDNKSHLCISDNGVGFDPEDARNLFGPFQRLHSQADFPGTGIGLATVQRIIQRHGGRIWAEAIKGEGASFNFTLEEAHE